MSETDMPITSAPHVLHPSCGAGFVRYRPAFTSIRVDRRPASGRLITINDDGHIVTFDLSAEQAGELASLLSSEVE